MPIRTHAARVTEFGAPPWLGEIDIAEPGDGEALVELDYASLNPLDTYVLAGAVGAAGGLPRTVGVEGAGRWDGKPVVVNGHGVGITRDGTWAGCVVAPRDALTPIPDGVSMSQAACAAVAGCTAIRVTRDLGQVTARDRVLVLGAAGGVGGAVITVCVSAGARVWGQTGHQWKSEAVAELGATPVVAASGPELREQAVHLKPTVVFDPLGADFTTAAIEILEPRGRLISYGVSVNPDSTIPMRTLYRNNLTIAGYGGVAEPADRIRDGIRSALRALADASMTIPVTQILPLSRVGKAIAELTARSTTGKIVLDLREGRSDS